MLDEKIKQYGGCLKTARAVGIDVATVWRHAKGRTRPSVDVLRSYAKALKIKDSELIDHYYPKGSTNGSH